MKCEKCFSLDLKVLESRARDTGVIARRRQCLACSHRFTTMELPPGALRYVRHHLVVWEQRQTGKYNTMVRQRRKIATLLCEARDSGKTAVDLAGSYGLTLAMVYYYTSPSYRKKLNGPK